MYVHIFKDGCNSSCDYIYEVIYVCMYKYLELPILHILKYAFEVLYPELLAHNCDNSS